MKPLAVSFAVLASLLVAMPFARAEQRAPAPKEPTATASPTPAPTGGTTAQPASQSASKAAPMGVSSAQPASTAAPAAKPGPTAGSSAQPPSKPTPTDTPAAAPPRTPPSAPAIAGSPDASDEPAKVAPATAAIKVNIHDLSPWSMFLNADIIVKAVICGLLFASLVTWTILIAKTGELLAARRSLRSALRRAQGARTLTEARQMIGDRRGLLQTFLTAAALEMQLSDEMQANGYTGLKERVASCLAEIARGEGRTIRRGMGLLATIGSTAPFVGLFGTVWGIMNSFIGISNSQTTNLAVVAPGIAEALLATAIGLVAAIPAVIIYNHFSRQTRAYLLVVQQASGAVDRLLSRDLDRPREVRLSRAAAE